MLFGTTGTQHCTKQLKLTISDKMFFPNTKASPEVGGRRPTSIEIVVLFPAPLCPSKTQSMSNNVFSLIDIDKD